MVDMIKLIVLSGGSGTRLWPFSRTNYPKQFFDLTGSGRPMLVETVDRLNSFGDVAIVTTENLKVPTKQVLERFHCENIEVVIEPEARNTAAAIAMMVARALREGVEVVAFFPADHEIKKADNFSQVLNLAISEAKGGNIVTIGIKPTYAATGYGYLKFESGDEVKSVDSFIEKPELSVAEELIEKGGVAWNAGIFVGSVERFAKELAEHMPELWENVQKYIEEEDDAIYAGLPNVSIDYGLMEKLSDLKCVQGDFGWCDIGSWEEAVNGDRMGTKPDVQIKGDGNNYAGILADKKKSVFVGVSDLIVLDTPDALMVLNKGEGQSVREAVGLLKEMSEEVTREHLFQERPWGRFENMRDEKHCKVKKLIIDPGKRISYQRHKFRSEHWVVVKGIATVTLDDKDEDFGVGRSIYVPAGVKHRLANNSDEPLEVIEVQYGSYFGEDDIERFSDDFGRL